MISFSHAFDLVALGQIADLVFGWLAFQTGAVEQLVSSPLRALDSNDLRGAKGLT